jgi:mannose-6-phosphate isomerase-like protein (cupin superfamily)
MTGFVVELEKATLDNENFRSVLYTAKHSQLVVMTIQPGDDIGLETHAGHDQFIRVEAGSAKAMLNGEEHELIDGSAVVIPAGTEHNIINTGSDKLKLYTLYTPPEHPDGTIHVTKADALADPHE